MFEFMKIHQQQVVLLMNMTMYVIFHSYVSSAIKAQL